MDSCAVVNTQWRSLCKDIITSLSDIESEDARLTDEENLVEVEQNYQQL